MRKWRKSKNISEEQRTKDTARSTLNMAVRRGEITREACWVCGETKTEAHHPDYNKPLDVVWLCRRHYFWLTEAARKQHQLAMVELVRVFRDK